MHINLEALGRLHGAEGDSITNIKSRRSLPEGLVNDDSCITGKGRV
jgi:hypothetical protein